MESIQQDRKRIQQKPVSRAYPAIHTYISTPQGKQESYDGDSDRGEERTQEQKITEARDSAGSRRIAAPYERTSNPPSAAPHERTTICERLMSAPANERAHVSSLYQLYKETENKKQRVQGERVPCIS